MSPSPGFWRKVVESSVKLCAESRLKAVTPGPRQKVTLGQVCSDQFKISLMLSLVSELCPPCLDRGGGDTSNAHGPVVCTGAVTRHPQNYWLRIWKRTRYWVRGCFVITTSDRDCLLGICNVSVCHVCLSPPDALTDNDLLSDNCFRAFIDKCSCSPLFCRFYLFLSNFMEYLWSAVL